MLDLLVAAYLSTLAEQPVRADWHCRNDIEVHCNDGSCLVIDEEETTPIYLSFNNAGEFSICAYSGCWSGAGTVLSTTPFFVISHKKAEWSFEPLRKSSAENVLIAFDPVDKVAIAKVGGFAHPFSCAESVNQSGD